MCTCIYVCVWEQPAAGLIKLVVMSTSGVHSISCVFIANAGTAMEKERLRG